jgi:hypothetical protein
MKGFFLVYENPGEKYDIKCELNANYANEQVPKEQQNLYVEVENACNIIKSLRNTDDTTKEKYFNKLLSLARVGLVGPGENNAQPELALKSLEKLKEEVTMIEGYRIKNGYMKELGIKALIISGIIGVIMLIVVGVFNIHEYDMYFITAVGALIGTWISFGVRKFSIDFFQLNIIEEDMMKPWIRLVYIAICSVVILLFINSGIVTIKIGNFALEEIRNNHEMQVVLGIICGLVESKIGINIYNKAITIIGTE